jgi:hypothetical protein
VGITIGVLQRGHKDSEEEEEMVKEAILGQGPHMGERAAELGRAKGGKSSVGQICSLGYWSLLRSDASRSTKSRLDAAEGQYGVYLEF